MLTCEIDIVERYPGGYIKYHSGVDRLRAVLFIPEPLAAPPEVLFLYGPSGVGKSTLPDRMLGDAVCRVRTPEGSDIFR